MLIQITYSHDPESLFSQFKIFSARITHGILTNRLLNESIGKTRHLDNGIVNDLTNRDPSIAFPIAYPISGPSNPLDNEVGQSTVRHNLKLCGIFLSPGGGQNVNAADAGETSQGLLRYRII